MERGGVHLSERVGGVVVGTDGGAAGWAAVAEASRLAVERGVPLHVVVAYGAREVRRALALELLARVAETLGAAERLTESAIRFHAVPARPSQALCDTAERVEASLIVVGNRGSTDRIRRVQRPICDRVRERARCDVLVLDTSAHWLRRVDDPVLTPLTRSEPMALWIEKPEPGWRLYLGGLRVHHGLVGELLALDGLRRTVTAAGRRPSRFGVVELLVGALMLSDDWRDFPFSLWES